ncbi:enoyl-CoA hydratase/isomerase family protein [Paraburkholderia pallida]|uniref:Enoyl-CoA hydratase n=1 Tax=Paraburkholderia pallida TaxID=2547399 RepID=A0A4P7CXX3_9BURK|nr:enoyl-CoA hydratase-related protein [Paraburkholderia pallida]QBQ99074.1 enoyl-CoA hydratase [Paraburkholderia pallida]
MDYTKYKTIDVKVENGIATLMLNRPEMLNAIVGIGDAVSHRELEDVWLELAEDSEVRVIILTGAGRAFSAGGNLKAMAGRFGKPEGWATALGATGWAPRMLSNILTVPQPIVAAVNGDCMGLGATVALFCDTVVMSQTGRIGDTHVKVGLVAGDGGSIIWPLLIGVARAKDFLMRGKIVDGIEAERIGLVSYAVPAEQVLSAAGSIAQELAALPPLAVRWTKRSINQTLREEFTKKIDAAIALESLSMMSQDHGSAAQGLLNKVRPTFAGK